MNTRSASLVILIVNWVAWVNPESKPPPFPPEAARYVQGASKEDWVTEWEKPLQQNKSSISLCSIYGRVSQNTDVGKKNVTSVPFDAVMLAGWNTNA